MDGNSLRWSDEVYRIFGYEPGEVEVTNDLFFERVHPDDRQKIRDTVSQAVAEGGTFQVEYRIIRPDGSERFVLEHAEITFDPPGQPRRILGAVQDITERKQVEQQLATSLQEKEVLLREVNHRVKNNLQAISNLIYLEAQTTADPLIRQKFEDTRNRIRSIGLIHEKLYQTKDFSQVHFGDYVESLVTSLVRSSRIDPNLIRVTIDSDPVGLEIDTITSLGIIVNELVTNALKYAFPADRPGDIEISLRQQAEGWLCLTVSDNGIGFPAEKDLSSVTGSLGLQLVQMLAGYMKGRIELTREGGTRFTITFRPGQAAQ